jgi:conjugative relaxase-like TrwC/TraI family protein
MLTIRAAKGSDYYERAEFARDDYYEERGQVRGVWAGRGAASIGLVGAPADGDLGTLLGGRNPDSGGALAGAGRRSGGNVAFDLTFTAPKSVSVLAAVGSDDIRRAVVAAHVVGTRAALDYLERHACFARRGRNGVRVLQAEGFMGAVYVHEMARSGDPHLHAHLVIANRVKGPDARWSAPDMRAVYAEAKTAGTIAEAVMRDALTQSLGVEWGPVRNGIAELAGVPEVVREHFSQRHAEIVEEAVARGYGSARGIDVVQRETRDRKRVASRDRAVAEWRSRAAEHGFGPRDIAAMTHRVAAVQQRRDVDLAAAEERMLGPAGLTRRRASFARREVIQALADAHPAGAAPGALERLADDFLARSCVPLRPSRVESGRGHQPALFSTPEMLRSEARLLIAATGVDPLGGIKAESAAVEAAIAARPTLGADQARAVRHLCSGEARARVLEARAGSGKTFALEAVREAYEAGGTPVVGVAWQGQAADLLQRDAGIPSQTAALLLDRLASGDDGAIPAGSVIVCDEASTMPTRALDLLLAEAAQRCARIVLVGDRAQLPAIDAAGGFGALADRLGAVELAENRRQQTELQRDVADLLASGRAADAVALLAKHDRLATFDDARSARDALIEAWADSSLADPTRALLLAHDRHEVSALNRMARRAMDEAGLLGRTRLTAAGREWAAGDALICRRNDYRLGVRNGTRGTVVKVDCATRAIDVVTTDGTAVRLDAAYLEHAHHGYALTGHVSQGATVDRTFLLATPERGGAEWAYVAASRQRLDLSVAVVHYDLERVEESLSRAWSRSDAKHLALDIAEPAHRNEALGRARDDARCVLPEGVALRRRTLLEQRERLRAVARTASREDARRAGRRAQSISADIRALEPVERRWAAYRAIARPSPEVLSVFGPRPLEERERQAWDRDVRVQAARSAIEPTHGWPEPGSQQAPTSRSVRE